MEKALRWSSRIFPKNSLMRTIITITFLKNTDAIYSKKTRYKNDYHFYFGNMNLEQNPKNI